ncbi:hypothetical protein CC86DRAFT_405852 [Ophiobolus disseminans]|uniref:Protein kinase domain-containing protein n=1 Tax=Ophiobolus disseminans TaxID=1469910 RepID=A0A6A6ZZT5_9PLEO|nr:hypothetical protein CC86DRAFT_405852 [Ophiobolus disseminans]
MRKDLQQEIVDNIVQSSNGMFMLAVLQMSTLEWLYDSGLSQGEIMIAMRSLPKDLDSTYQEVLRSRISPGSRETVRRAFRWLAFSEERLSIDELAEAVALSPGSPRLVDLQERPTQLSDVLHGLGGLVSVNEDSIILFVHYTVRNFLLSESAEDFRIDPDKCRTYLAECCLGYMLCYAQSTARQGNSNDFGRFPLLSYATRNWTGHVRLSRRVQDKLDAGARVEQLVRLFLFDGDALNINLMANDPNDVDRDPFPARLSRAPDIFYAVSTGLKTIVKEMIQQGAATTCSDYHGRQPLHVAVKLNEADIVQMLLDNGAEATTKDKDGESPLSMAAASTSHYGTFKILLLNTEPGLIKDLDVKGTPFLCAAAQGYDGEVLHLLLEHLRLSMDDLNAGYAEDGHSLLHLAVKEGNLSSISILLEAGVDVNVGDKNDDRPLHYAVRFDQDGARDILLAKHADQTLVNKGKKTPLEEMWSKRSLDWSSYQVDPELEKESRLDQARTSQAKCHILSKQGDSVGPKTIFSKTYDWSGLNNEEVKMLYRALMREKSSFERLDHPFVVSYLGFVTSKVNKRLFTLYLEYCDAGDLETRHVKRTPPKKDAHPNDAHPNDEEELLPDLDLSDSDDVPVCEALSEKDMWTLMYQLFAALAYLHYGITISKSGEVGVERHWDTKLHRDIKPHNIILKTGPRGKRIAKLCDLGHVRNLDQRMTVATYRGTPSYWPPEIKDMTLREQQWSTKGDVWCLARTLQEVEKDFKPSIDMDEILIKCCNQDPAERWSSLTALQRIHRYQHFLQEPYASFQKSLGGNPPGYEYQAFLHIVPALNTKAPFTGVTRKQRIKLLQRLRLVLTDGQGGWEIFRENCNSIHLAVLFNEEPVLQRLLSVKGQDPDEPWPGSEWTALHLAVQEDRQRLVEILLSANADRQLQDVHEKKAIYYAHPDSASFYNDLWKRQGVSISFLGATIGRQKLVSAAMSMTLSQTDKTSYTTTPV